MLLKQVQGHSVNDNFIREFDLPISVEKETIKARYEDGVLFVTVPKTSKSKTRQVSVE